MNIMNLPVCTVILLSNTNSFSPAKNTLNPHMALPPDSSDLPQHPNAVSGLSASCTHSFTHSHPSLLFIFNPVNQTLLTDDADPHAALTPSAREREREKEAGKTGTSCGKERRRRENKVLKMIKEKKHQKCIRYVIRC